MMKILFWVMTAVSFCYSTDSSTITVVDPDHGTIVNDDPLQLESGETGTFHLVPDANYHVAGSPWGNDFADSADTPLVVLYGATDRTLSGNVVIDTHEVALSQGANTALSRKGDQYFAYGEVCTTIAVAASGYAVSMAGRPYKAYPTPDTMIFMVTDDSTVTSLARSNTVFAMRIKTNNVGPSGDDQFTLAVKSGETYNYTINWGDGNTEVQTADTSPVHTYASAGEYDIWIAENVERGFATFYFNNGGDKLKVIDLQQWGTNWVKNMVGAFYGCENMDISATDLNRFYYVTSFESAFRNTGVDTFPYMNMNAATGLGSGYSMTFCWADCKKMRKFTAFNSEKCVNFASTWKGDTLLDSFPVLNMIWVAYISSAWEDCGFIYFPAIDFNCSYASNLDFTKTWYNCTKMRTFGKCNVSKGTTFHQTWQNDYVLDSFPDIDFTNATTTTHTWRNNFKMTIFRGKNFINTTDISEAWVEDTSLVIFDPQHDTNNFKKVRSANWTFNHCKNMPRWYSMSWDSLRSATAMFATCSLTTRNDNYYFPQCTTAVSLMESGYYLDTIAVIQMPKLKNGDDLFQYVHVPTATYSAILDSFAAQNINEGVAFDGGNSFYAASVQDERDYLTSTLGWTITDRGPVSSAVTVTVAPSPHGSVTLFPIGGVYPEGTEITITATPDSGETFIQWSRDISDSVGNPLTYIVGSSDVTVSAVFSGSIPLRNTKCWRSFLSNWRGWRW